MAIRDEVQGRTYFRVNGQRARDLLAGMEGEEDEPEVLVEAPRRVPVAPQLPARAQPTGLQLPFTLTWERILLIVLAIYLIVTLLRRARRGENKLRKLGKAVRALQRASAPLVIDVE